MTIPELEQLGYTVAEAMPATEEHPLVYSVTGPNLLIYVAEPDLAALTLPDPNAPVPKAAPADPVLVVDPLSAIAALDPATATAADIIKAART